MDVGNLAPSELPSILLKGGNIRDGLGYYERGYKRDTVILDYSSWRIRLHV